MSRDALDEREPRRLGDGVDSFATSVGIARCSSGVLITLFFRGVRLNALSSKYESIRHDVPTVSAVECVENVP